MPKLLAENNAVSATQQLLQLSNVSVTQTGLSEALKQHPDFPSLSAISAVLREYNVPNLATRLNPERLFEVPLPAMVCVEEGDTRLFAPVSTLGEQIVWWHSQRGWQTDQFKDFVRKWTGVILLVEPSKNAGEPNFTHNHWQERLKRWRWVFVLTVGIMLISTISWYWLQKWPLATNLYYYSLVGIELSGVLVSALLVWYGIDGKNSFLQKVCQVNLRANCQHVLQSPAAKLTEWLSWSEVGLFYFTGSLLYLLIQPQFPVLIWGLSVLALPYTVWSVYYQWRIAREWCVLCLTVQLLLWASFFITSYWLWDIGSVPSINLINLFKLTIAFAPTPMLWATLRRPLQNHSSYDELLQNFQRLKFDPDYLKLLTSRTRILPLVLEGMNPVCMGNPAAKYQLAVVTNPTCASCRRNHTQIRQLADQFHNVFIQVFFSANLSEDDVASRVACQILSLPPAQQEIALDRWFNLPESRYKYWAETTAGDYRSAEAIRQMSMHLRWLELADVSSTPVVFLNNVEIPKIYLAFEYRRLLSFILNHEIGQFT